MRAQIAAFYTPSSLVLPLATWMLGWLALYHIVDALQVFLVFTLRCYRVTVLPLIVYTVMLWGVGLAGGYHLAYADWPWAAEVGLAVMSPLSFWQAAIVALTLTCMVLGPKLWRSSRQAVASL